MKFVNCTQHALTPDQRANAIERFGATEFVEFRDANPELFARLAQIEPNEDLKVLAWIFSDWLIELGTDAVVHLPIGSPGFQFVLGETIGQARTSGVRYPLIVFSHSRRDSVDVPQPDGTVKKNQVFTFERFLAL